MNTNDSTTDPLSAHAVDDLVRRAHRYRQTEDETEDERTRREEGRRRRGSGTPDRDEGVPTDGVDVAIRRRPVTGP